MPSQPGQVLILTGPPGVGKSSVAEILARSWDRSVHLEADAFFRFVRSGYVEPWAPESHGQNEVVMEIVADAAARYAIAGYATVVDGIVIPRWFLGTLREGLRAAGVPAAFAVLRASRAECAARVAAREGGAVPLDEAALAGIWSQFADLGDYERHVVAVDGLGPQEAAASVAAGLAEGRLAL